MILHLAQPVIDVLAAADPGSVAPPGGDKFLTAAGYVKWATGIACVVGLLVCAITMALSHRRGSGGEHGSAVAWVLGASVLSGVAAALVTAMGA